MEFVSERPVNERAISQLDHAFLNDIIPAHCENIAIRIWHQIDCKVQRELLPLFC
jgi:6-pyruvoyl-tetrahydropterin synthase